MESINMYLIIGFIFGILLNQFFHSRYNIFYYTKIIRIKDNYYLVRNILGSKWYYDFAALKWYNYIYQSCILDTTEVYYFNKKFIYKDNV